MKKRTKGNAIIGVAWSHGRPRTELRRPSDGGTPTIAPETVDTVPVRDPKTGRWTAGNQAARRQTVKRLAEGIATLNPAACPPWMRSHVAEGAAYAMTLLGRYPDPALARLVGTTVDTWVVSRALLSLGAGGDEKALKEARMWSSEHRACLRELASLGAIAKKATSDDSNDLPGATE